jgi:hypothetical protein
MLSKVLRNRSEGTISPGGLVVTLTPSLRAALDHIGDRWRCGPERAAQRIIVLALTGWKLRDAELLERLSAFVPGEDAFRRTCFLLRNHFDAAEVELGEGFKECDRIAWLETLRDTLKERQGRRERAILTDLLASGALTVKEDDVT